MGDYGVGDIEVSTRTEMPCEHLDKNYRRCNNPLQDKKYCAFSDEGADECLTYTGIKERTDR